MARLSPYTFVQEFDNNGDPLNGGKLYTYSAGTTTPKATYTDNTGSTANSNPIILDSSGRASIWLDSGAYKFVLKDSADVTIETKDNIAGDSENAFGSSVVDRSTNLSVTSAYKNAVINCTAALTLSLDSAAVLGEGFYFSAINNGSGTITIDPYGSETINGVSSLSLISGQSCLVISDGTNWSFLFNSSGFTTGDVKLTIKTVADYGFIMCNDGTIGSASSGATTRANADTVALYTLLWTNVSDTYAPVSGGRGSSADSDFSANKPIALTKMLGRALGLSGAGSGLTSRVLGFTVGAESHTLITDEIPSHNHGVTDPGHTHGIPMFHFNGDNNTVSNGSSNVGGTTQTASAKTGITIGNKGGGLAHNNMQPTSFMNAMIKL